MKNTCTWSPQTNVWQARDSTDYKHCFSCYQATELKQSGSVSLCLQYIERQRHDKHTKRAEDKGRRGLDSILCTGRFFRSTDQQWHSGFLWPLLLLCCCSAASCWAVRCLVVVVIFLFSQAVSALQAFRLSQGETCSKQIIIVFSEHTHYNSHIVRDRKTFHDRRLSENCVTMVTYFMDEEGNILSFADF